MHWTSERSLKQRATSRQLLGPSRRTASAKIPSCEKSTRPPGQPHTREKKIKGRATAGRLHCAPYAHLLCVAAQGKIVSACWCGERCAERGTRSASRHIITGPQTLARSSFFFFWVQPRQQPPFTPHLHLGPLDLRGLGATATTLLLLTLVADRGDSDDRVGGAGR
jgi:hypothetical protein